MIERSVVPTDTLSFQFLDRECVGKLKTVFICEKHFEEKYLNRNELWTRLNMSGLVPSKLVLGKLIPREWILYIKNMVIIN